MKKVLIVVLLSVFCVTSVSFAKDHPICDNLYELCYKIYSMCSELEQSGTGRDLGIATTHAYMEGVCTRHGLNKNVTLLTLYTTDKCCDASYKSISVESISEFIKNDCNRRILDQ